jgi:hypothetical protein
MQKKSVDKESLYPYKDYIKKSKVTKFLIYNKSIKEIKKEKNMLSIEEMLSKLEGADNTVKNEIENKLVSIGSSAVPELVNQLQVVRGIKRGVVAMTLIRIGGPSVAELKKAANSNKDFEWVAKYLISEITGELAA